MACSRFGFAGRNQVLIDPAFANSPARPRSRFSGKRSPPAAPGWNDAPHVRTYIRRAPVDSTVSSPDQLPRAVAHYLRTISRSTSSFVRQSMFVPWTPRRLVTGRSRPAACAQRDWSRCPRVVHLAADLLQVPVEAGLHCGKYAISRSLAHQQTFDIFESRTQSFAFSTVRQPRYSCHLLLDATPMMASRRWSTVLLPGAAPSPSFASCAPAAHACPEQIKADPTPHGHSLPGCCSTR